MVDFGSLTLLPMPWDKTLRTLKGLAEAVDQDLALDMPKFDLATASVGANDRFLDIKDQATTATPVHTGLTPLPNSSSEICITAP